MTVLVAVPGGEESAVAFIFVYPRLIEINIQIRAIEAVATIGTEDLTIPFVHLMSATIANVFMLGCFRLVLFGIRLRS